MVDRVYSTLLVVLGLLVVICVSQVTRDGVCKDKIANCDDYGLKVCVSDRAWADRNCRKFCFYCNGTHPTNRPCHYNGKTYQDGDFFVDDCWECVCKDMGRECNLPKCEKYPIPRGCKWVQNPSLPYPKKCCHQPWCPPGVTLPPHHQ